MLTILEVLNSNKKNPKKILDLKAFDSNYGWIHFGRKMYSKKKRNPITN
jgi:hypothetical protein